LNANAENKFIKKAHPQKSLATAQNTLSFFFCVGLCVSKKNERVFSPTLYSYLQPTEYLSLKLVF